MANGKFTAKQRKFIDEYLVCLNAAEAARRAGYSEKTARSMGCQLLTNINIKAEIKQRMEDAMSSEEVLFRLAEQARGDVGEFVDPATLTLDMQKAKEDGKTRLIKKIKQTLVTRTIGQEEQQTEIFEFELYDAQKALALLGKYHKLFVDRIEHATKDDKPIALLVTKMDIDEL
jgi:phage terminase small subunit